MTDLFEAYPLRDPCSRCRSQKGVIEERSGQKCVFCLSCKRFLYNAPKTETGAKVRSVSSRPKIKPKQRARILDRDNSTCVGCHRADTIVHVAHLLSVEDGRALGATEEELFSDENLATMCEECNLGFSGRSVSLRLVFRLLQARIRRAERQGA